MPMPNASSKQYPTMNNLYSVSSSQQRNFVLENKQSIREKSKLQRAKNLDIPMAKSGTQIGQKPGIYTAFACNLGRTQRSNGVSSIDGNLGRSQSRQKTIQLQTPPEPAEKVLPNSSVKAVGNMQRRHLIPRVIKPRAESIVEMQSVAVQTDEIRDEFYLYSALKKCASSDFKRALKAKYMQKSKEEKQASRQRYIDTSDEEDIDCPPNEGPDHYTKKNRHHRPRQNTESHNKQHKSPREESFTLELSPHNKPHTQSQSQSQSQHRHGRHQVIDLSAFNTVPSDVNDLFNVMSLPPELKKRCQPNVCVDCPEGYHRLTEKERENLKRQLLEHESLLIRQLNSFPLIIETIRLQQTKARIERDLASIEEHFRKLAKKRVYVKLGD